MQLPDFDADGVSVGAAAVADDRTPAYGFVGNIFFAGTDVPIDYTHTGRVALNFNTQVVVEGGVSATLYLGHDGYHWEGTARQTTYLSGSGTDTLTFGYTVRPGDTDPRGIMVALGTETTSFGGSGTIKDRDTSVERNPWYLGRDPQPSHKVDTEPPAVSWLGIASEPANGRAYAAGETVIVQVAFSGNPYMELNVGGVSRRPWYGPAATTT